jgi:hypothetical protein
MNIFCTVFKACYCLEAATQCFKEGHMALNPAVLIVNVAKLTIVSLTRATHDARLAAQGALPPTSRLDGQARAAAALTMLRFPSSCALPHSDLTQVRLPWPAPSSLCHHCVPPLPAPPPATLCLVHAR